MVELDGSKIGAERGTPSTWIQTHAPGEVSWTPWPLVPAAAHLAYRGDRHPAHRARVFQTPGTPEADPMSARHCEAAQTGLPRPRGDRESAAQATCRSNLTRPALENYSH